MSSNAASINEDLLSEQNALRLNQALKSALESRTSILVTPSTFLGHAEAFLIFAKYEDKYWEGISAEHDEIWSGPSDASRVSAEDRERLEELGWSLDDESGFHRFV